MEETFEAADVRGILHRPDTPNGHVLLLTHGAGSDCRAPLLVLGGHSYGGRQSAMLAASRPEIADRLLLLSYPLHPPKDPANQRTAFFPDLRIPALFVHGTRDPFASLEELRDAMALIPARTDLLPVEGAGHDLARAAGLAKDIIERLEALG